MKMGSLVELLAPLTGPAVTRGTVVRMGAAQVQVRWWGQATPVWVQRTSIRVLATEVTR